MNKIQFRESAVEVSPEWALENLHNTDIFAFDIKNENEFKIVDMAHLIVSINKNHVLFINTNG